MARFHDINGSGSGGDGDTKTKQETAALELANAAGVDCGAGNNSTHDDEEASNEHADSPAPSIYAGADERKGADTTNLVHGGDNTSPNTVVGAMEEAEELLVGGQTVEQRTIKAIHSLAEEAKKTAEKEEECPRVRETWLLCDESLIVGSTTFDDFDLCHSRLRVWNQLRLGGQHRTKICSHDSEMVSSQ